MTLGKHPAARCRVLHVLGRMVRGGAELRTLEVIRQLAPQGIICDVLALSGLPGELDSEVAHCGGRVILLARHWGWQRRLCRVLRLGNYSAVHSHVHHFSGWILRVAYQAGVPVRVAQFHSLEDGKGDRLLRRAYRWRAQSLIDHYATAVLGVSRSVLDSNWPNHRTDHRCQVLYNGVDLPSFSSAVPREEVRKTLFGVNQAEVKVVIHVGNLTAPKNHAMILRIFTVLAHQRQDAHLLLVGRGDQPSEVELRHQIAAHPHAARIHFLGSRSDVPALLLAADVFLFPSLREGLPGALIEACAAGLPCLASDIAPCSEVAELIPLVECMSLDYPAEAWSEKLSNKLAENRRLSPSEAGHLVTAAGFDVIRSSESYAALWRGLNAR